MTYVLTLSPPSSLFSVPTEVVDQHLNSAPFKAVDLLLYILRYHLTTIDAQDLSRRLFLSEHVVQTALSYWEENNILRPAASEKQNLPRIQNAKKEIESFSAVESKLGSAILSSAKTTSEPVKKPSAQEILALTQQFPDLRFLLATAPSILGRLLTQADTSTLAFLFHTEQLPVDLLLMLLQYAASLGHRDMRFVEKMARKWKEAGIDSHEKAERYLKEQSKLDAYIRHMQELLGISEQKLTPREREALQVWFSQLHPAEELIVAAKERTIQQTGKFSLLYLHSILSSWCKKGYQKRADIPEKRRSGSSKKKETSYDLEAFDRFSLENTPQN